MSNQPEQPERVVYVERQPSNGMAVAALVCGIVGTVFGLVPLTYLVALAAGAVAVALGFVARRRAKRDPSAGRKTMATWGIVLGAVAIALGVVGAVIIDDTLTDLERDLDQIEQE